MIGFILAELVKNKDLQSAGVVDYLRVATYCLLWPGFILQQITTKDE